MFSGDEKQCIGNKWVKTPYLETPVESKRSKSVIKKSVIILNKILTMGLNARRISGLCQISMIKRFTKIANS